MSVLLAAIIATASVLSFAALYIFNAEDGRARLHVLAAGLAVAGAAALAAALLAPVAFYLGVAALSGTWAILTCWLLAAAAPALLPATLAVSGSILVAMLLYGVV